MKCQRCPKQATYHITEVMGENNYQDLHLCEECTQKHLADPMASIAKPGEAKPLSVSVEEYTDLGNRQCEACGIKFVEFRNTGRLGCPHDYDSFREELLPLLDNIHGDTRHVGKVPRRLPKLKSDQLELKQLRRELQAAVTREAYEDAARLRDRIRQIEQG